MSYKDFIKLVEAQRDSSFKDVVIDKELAVDVAESLKRRVEASAGNIALANKNRILSTDPKKIANRKRMRRWRKSNGKAQQ